VAKLAKEILATSVKLMLELLMDCMTTFYHNLVKLSRFGPQDKWLFTTQVVQGIFVYTMSNARSEL
jgi:hypothetical protein